MLSKLIYKKNNVSFCNKSWRNLIKNVCKQIDKNNIGLQVISPFGFELLEDKKFLHGSIKRLYCYIGVPENVRFDGDLSAISKAFSDQLLSSIHQIGLNLSDIAILVLQEKFTMLHDKDYQCSHNDKLIDIQTKVISDDILRDYANYIICTVDSIFSKKEEPEHFIENKRHRCRTFQLYIMLEKVFGYLLPPMTVFQEENFLGMFKLIDNSIQIFYTPTELFINASEYELHVLNTLIQPRVELMRQAIRLSDPVELINLRCEAYHVPGKLELEINKNIHKNAVEKIRATYLNYC